MMKRDKFNPSDYDFYVKEYIRMSEEKGIPITHPELRKEPYNLPDARWYINNCPCKDVTRWAEFVDWCGFVANAKPPTKEKATKLIYKMQEKLDRPIMYDDFRGKGCYHIGIELIRKHWGSINKMKEELGLEIVQESMTDRKLNKDEFNEMISDIVNFVKSDNRDFITTYEIDIHKEWLNADSLRRISLKYYNKSLSEILLESNIRLGNQGSGIGFIFYDGEHTSSQYEYMFSKYLKSNGFIYNTTYFRDVRYSTFIDGYNQLMNCDYVLNVNGENIYIEIAGIIESHKEWYYADKQITCSKSKEKYRLKLKEKEEMLKKQGLKYFII